MTDRDNSSLAELVKLCQAGDSEAWRRLIKRLLPIIFSICRSMRLSRDESFDIFGQVSYLILQNLDQLQSPSKIISYVGTTTRREIFDMRRRAKFHEHVPDVHLQEQEDEESATPHEHLVRLERHELLLEALAELPERDYRLLRLLFFDQSRPNYEEVSRLMGIPVASIGPTRQRSLERLRKLLRKKGYKP